MPVILTVCRIYGPHPCFLLKTDGPRLSLPEFWGANDLVIGYLMFARLAFLWPFYFFKPLRFFTFKGEFDWRVISRKTHRLERNTPHVVFSLRWQFCFLPIYLYFKIISPYCRIVKIRFLKMRGWEINADFETEHNYLMNNKIKKIRLNRINVFHFFSEITEIV